MHRWSTQLHPFLVKQKYHHILHNIFDALMSINALILTYSHDPGSLASQQCFQRLCILILFTAALPDIDFQTLSQTQSMNAPHHEISESFSRRLEHQIHPYTRTQLIMYQRHTQLFTTFYFTTSQHHALIRQRKSFLL